MVQVRREPSGRQEELLERAYGYALAHGISDLSLRPLATAIGSSPRVLLFLFGSKAGLVRALLDRARTDELALLDRIRRDADDSGFAAVVRTTRQWLSADAHRPLLALWLEAYARSLVEPNGPWKGFGRQTVDDWLDVLAAAQSSRRRNSSRGAAERTVALSVLRGALLDLLATREVERTTTAVSHFLGSLRTDVPPTPRQS